MTKARVRNNYINEAKLFDYKKSDKMDKKHQKRCCKS